MEPMKPMAPMKPMEPMKKMDFGPAWWPDELGTPQTSGGQEDVQYAFFAGKRRLALRKDGTVTVYDSGDHEISGVQQDRARGLVFTSQKGRVDLEALTRV